MPSALHLEFTVEPFVEAEPGPHVLAAIDAARTALADQSAVRVGPFGTSVNGPAPEVLTAVSSLLQEAFGRGANRVSIQISRQGPSIDDPDNDQDRSERP